MNWGDCNECLFNHEKSNREFCIEHRRYVDDMMQLEKQGHVDFENFQCKPINASDVRDVVEAYDED